MKSFFSAEGGPIWIKFRRLAQNDMSIVDCGDMVEIITGRIPIWRTFWRIQWHVVPEPHVTLQATPTASPPLGELTTCIMIQKPHATLQGAVTVTLRNHCRHPATLTLQGVSYSPYLKLFFAIFFFVFLIQFGLSRAAAFVSSPIVYRASAHWCAIWYAYPSDGLFVTFRYGYGLTYCHSFFSTR